MNNKKIFHKSVTKIGKVPMVCTGFVCIVSYRFLLTYLLWPEECNLYLVKYLTEKLKLFI